MQNRPLAHILVVFLGGIVGSALRLGLDMAIPHGDDDFPLSTLLINIVGSFVLGFLTSGLFARDVSSLVKAAVGPGLLGSFTTFSAVIIALVLLTASGGSGFALAVIYLCLTVALGFGAAFIGLRLGSLDEKRRARSNEGSAR